MGTMDLRPLSLGELLDRTFTLYRRHFLLFVGISAIPYLLVLALQLVSVFVSAGERTPVHPPVEQQFQAGSAATAGMAIGGLVLIGVVIATLVALLLSQGATVLAVSEIYLGRVATVGDSFRRVRGEFWTLLAVAILSGFATGLASIFLIIPGIYVFCRLAVAIPSAVLEDLGARDSLERSWGLTKENVGRILLIYLFSFILAIAASSLFEYPFTLLIVAARRDPAMVRMWTALMQMGGFAAQVLIAPIGTIAISLLYYDLRVRKEAFDLQMLMRPLGGPAPYNPNAPHPLV